MLFRPARWLVVVVAGVTGPACDGGSDGGSPPPSEAKQAEPARPATEPEPAAEAGTRAEGAVDPPEPERPPSGYAILPPGTELRMLPDATAPSVALPELAPHASSASLPPVPRGYLVMITGTDSDFLEVETLRPPEGERHCEEPLPALEGFRLRFYVPADAPARVTTRALRIDGAEGTELALAPGTPLRPRATGRFVAEGNGVRVEVALPDDAVGRSYEPEASPTERPATEHLPAGARLTFDGSPLQGAERLPGAPTVEVLDHRRDADGVLARVSAGCLSLQVRSSAEPLPPEVVAAATPPSPSGPGISSRTEYEPRAGATVYWPDNRVAGQVAHEHRFTEAPTEAGSRRCFELALGDGALPLCFDPGDIVEHETHGLALVGYGAATKAGPRTPAIRGVLDKEEIRRVIRSHIRSIQSCYETSLMKRPTLEGKVVLQITVGSTGKVTNVEATTDTLSEPEVAECVIARAKTWVFPPPRGGATAEIRYPFVFKTD